MKWLDDIRSSPPEDKLRVVAIILVGALVLLIGIWIIVGNYRYGSTTGDTSLFRAIGSDIHSIKNY